jgi:hypothetical protein
MVVVSAVVCECVVLGFRRRAAPQATLRDASSIADEAFHIDENPAVAVG